MSVNTRDALTRWLPLAVAIITNLVLVAFGYGQLQQRIAPIENHATSAPAVYVPRTEYAAAIASRDREMGDLRETLRTMDAKLDRLIERNITSK